MRQLRSDTVRVIKTSDMMDMLKAIEENLIAISLWSKVRAEGGSVTDFELLLGLHEAMAVIKIWHGMSSVNESQALAEWELYQKSPEMVRLNALIKKYSGEEVGDE